MRTAAHSAARGVVALTMLAGCYLSTADEEPHGDPCEAFEQDLDSDGWGDCSDCDDRDPSVHPGVVADGGCCGQVDGRDNDCDGAIDEDPSLCDVDCDPGLDGDGDGYFSPADCNDFDPYVHPGVFDASDPCIGTGNGVDDDCDGEVDEDWIGEPQGGCDLDRDGDGWSGTADCDDMDPAVNPGAWEDVCCHGDGRDNDCDGQVDESWDSDAACDPCAECAECDVDQDGDGWPDIDDCDDTDPTRHPGGVEYCCPCRDEGGGFEYPDCNGADDDCDGLVDETSLREMAEDELCCGGWEE
jgi:hypothetical protein